MTLQAVIRPAASKPLGALVLLHGRGADEHDLAPLSDGLDPMGRLVFATPRAPISEGFGAHWYHLVQLGVPEATTFAAARSALTTWLDAFLREQGLDHAHCILGGFSQGAVMSYAYALSPAAPQVAGLLCFSGYVPQAPGFQTDPGRLQGLPIFMNHGTHDRMIPFPWGQKARETVEAAGAAVTFREFRGEHQIDGEGMRQARIWLNQRVAAWTEART